MNDIMANVVKYVEILTTQNRKNLDLWKFHGPVCFKFDEVTKGYLLDCNGGSLAVPKNQKRNLKLIRNYVLLQVFFFPGKLMTLELVTTDSQGAKRRIMLTSCKNVVNNLMHSRLPNSFIEKNSWLHLYINIPSLFSLCFPNSTFRSLDGIYLSAFCKVRRIYSLSEMDIDYLLPSGFELPKYVQVKTQLINSDSFLQFTPSPSLRNPSHNSQNSNSLSLPKIGGGKKSNIFYDPENLRSIRQSLQDVPNDYMKGISLAAKKIFRNETQENTEGSVVRVKDKIKKINHVQNKDNNESELEGNVKVFAKSMDENPVIQQLRGTSDPQLAIYKTPDYYDINIKSQLEPRHKTPPFTNLKGSLVYNPLERSYENSPKPFS